MPTTVMTAQLIRALATAPAWAVEHHVNVADVRRTALIHVHALLARAMTDRQFDAVSAACRADPATGVEYAHALDRIVSAINARVC